ncbi:MAG: hypothetical protein KZQ64_10905 [gamma proteobacterium symbiont of Bathyaustriella thionipta]|nr:hypothetical protein [gamma proteobacterium symbiont of Bathyaustriella thionipta]MCU7948706.1 hypothetical protein [gamma proteobacterium symbiont of Bathyaustriella thionipta]MCU7953883.1 hypothetical protein [gamma proteobacterium symbiont of Bathyaustriella thionipta]MCU7955021.1 hypothetical protein [gamma proteobacterium symbiont of Bathyaustriella thionipta]MCU7966874.1 hypothetical protein [gamma proteobacterium symbiont of Bathyaustriella thionipta]
MHVKAIIEQGEVKLLAPVNLKHDKVNIELIIPDNEIIKEEQTNKITVDEYYMHFSPEIQAMMRDIDDIRSQYIKDSEIPELSEEQQLRIKAFSHRKEFKGE